MKRFIILLISFFILATSTVAFAESNSEENIIADALVMRPVGIVSLVAGSAIFVVSLPFAAITNDIPKTTKQLVVKPFRYTFRRPLGDFKYKADPTDYDRAPQP